MSLRPVRLESCTNYSIESFPSMRLGCGWRSFGCAGGGRMGRPARVSSDRLPLLDYIPTDRYADVVGRSAVGVKALEATRHKLLDAAFAEFYANGFQGGSLNHPPLATSSLA